MHRQTSLTPETSAKILRAIREGNYKITACAEAGIHRDTLNGWEHRGAAGEEPYASFSDSLKKAEAIGERRLLARLRKAPQNWQAFAWILERKFPARWGGRVRATVQDELAQMFEHLRDSLEPETYEKVMSVALAKRSEETAAPIIDARHKH